MSAPPPGGSPPPQSPPQYQQYPPQQPYYAQAAAPPPKKSNTALIIVVVVVIVVVALALIAWWAVTTLLAPVNTVSQITITGVSWTVNYPGTTQYFGASPLTSCTVCPLKVSLFAQFTYTLTLSNSDTNAHTVSDVTLAGTNFTLYSTSPDVSTTPLSIPAGSSRSVVLTIQPSTLGGSYTLTGTITTT